MTREEAEKLCRQVIASHAGEPLAENLFQESVELLMKEANTENELIDSATLMNLS